MKKLLLLMSVVILLVSGLNVWAGDINWNGSVSSSFSLGTNWDGGSFPGSGDNAIIPVVTTNYPLITSGTYTISEFKTHVVTQSGSIDVNMVGGTLNCTNVKIIARGGAGDVDTFYMSDGTINSSGKIYLNFDSDVDAVAIFDMTDGIVNTTELVLPGTENPGAVCTFKLHGGNLRTAAIVFRDNSPDAIIDIADDGILTLDGDQRTAVTTAYNADRITSYSGTGQIQSDYGITESGKTTVIAIAPTVPEPCEPNFEDIYAYTQVFASVINSEKTLMSSIAGTVNRVVPQVCIGGNYWNANYRPEFWTNKYANMKNLNLYVVNDPAWYIDKFKPLINGYVFYDLSSLNAATSLAGVLGGIMVDSSTLSYATNAGLPMLADARTYSDSSVYSTYSGQFSKDMIFNVDTGKAYEMRDLAITNLAYISYDIPESILANQNDNTLELGFGSNESSFFDDAADNSLSIIAGSSLINTSATSQWNDVPFEKQKTHTDPTKATESNVHYAAFVLSDGDNLAFMLKSFLMNPNFFASPYRGSFNMNYDLTPAIADFNPLAMNYLYEQSSQGTYKDYFVTAGGEGITFPSQYPDEQGYADTTEQSMKKADHKVVSVLDTNYDSSILSKLLAKKQVIGVMYKTYNNAYKGYNGQIFWINGKPVVTVKYSLWNGYDSPDEIISALNSAPTSPTTNQGSYSIINVHPWSTTTSPGYGAMQNVNYIVDNLDSNVRVVTLDELFIHLRRNFGSEVTYPTLEKIADNWLDQTCQNPGWCNGADVNGDGRVDLIDLADFAMNYY